MRPLRAFAVLGLLLGVWSNWRFQEARATYSAMLASSAAPMARAPAPFFNVRLAMELVESDQPVWTAGLARGTRAGLPVGIRATPPSPPAPELASSAMEPRQLEPAAAVGGDRAFSAAAGAYRALAEGDRRNAAKRFEAAIVAAPAHANAKTWSAELRQLRKRWNLDAYTQLREGGGPAAPTVQPVLGGGQSGAHLGYVLNPLAARPVELFARLNVAQDWLDLDRGSTQAALGAAWRPFGRSGPTLSAERLVAVGNDGRDAWAGRIAGGAGHMANTGMPIDLDAYAETGVVGLRRGDVFAGAQAYALYPLLARDKLRVAIGAATWGSAQHSAAGMVSRLEIGPSAQVVRRIDAGAIELRIDYRRRIAGAAAPGSGPAVTIVSRY